MAERTIYTCDLCKKEFDEAIPKGPLYYSLIVGSLCYATKQLLDIDHQNTCKNCLSIIDRELAEKFDEVISKLSQNLMG
jgi:DNA-directed RNA polymerase subunit RPC12/RpoP